MPELRLAISFPNLTSDGYPVLYPTGWSSSDVSYGWFSIFVITVSFQIFFSKLLLKITFPFTYLFCMRRLACMGHGTQRTSEGNS
jgi:hypothetical protein